MDERTSRRFPPSHLAALILFLAVAGCRNPTKTAAVGKFASEQTGISCELPGAPWVRHLDTPAILSLSHPDADNLQEPRIEIADDKGRTRQELETLRSQSLAARKGDPTFKAAPVREIKIAGLSAWLRDEISINAMAAGLHLKHGEKPYQAVSYRELHVYLTSAKGSFRITYRAPTSLFEKHFAEFEKLLASLKFNGA